MQFRRLNPFNTCSCLLRFTLFKLSVLDTGNQVVHRKFVKRHPATRVCPSPSNGKCLFFSVFDGVRSTLTRNTLKVGKIFQAAQIYPDRHNWERRTSVLQFTLFKHLIIGFVFLTVGLQFYLVSVLGWWPALWCADLTTLRRAWLSSSSGNND